MERTQDIQKHRIQMMAEKDHQEREQKEANRAMLQQKRDHDFKVHGSMFSTPKLTFLPLSVTQFHQAQQEKAQKAFKEATELQQFLRNQVVEREEQQKAEKREEKEMNSCNRHLTEVAYIHTCRYTCIAISLSTYRWSKDSSLSMLKGLCQWPEHRELLYSLW